MEFESLNLHADLQKGLTDAGYITAMPVQEQVIAQAFGGRDLYVQSQTGTGKTAAFLIVIFQRLLSEPLLTGRKALIMTPTRELAVQVEEEAKVIGKYLPFRIGSFYGGVGYGPQRDALRDGCQVLVGTPGRVLDLNEQGQMNLMDVAFLIIDEADRMFDMGFYPDLRRLIKVVPPADRRQTMLFSATLNSYVKNLAWEYTKEPVEIEIAPEVVTVEEIDQLLYHVPSEQKMRLLLGILRREEPESAIIFCNTKRYTETIARRLRENGFPCEFIMGDLPQNQRLAIIEDLKAGKNKLLVATDVAARGLDIEGLSLVINYDIPSETENYVHRIGRTARAGKTGKAITFASEQDVYELTGIERYIGKKIPAEVASEDLLGEDVSSPPHERGERRRSRYDERERPRQRYGQGEREPRHERPPRREERERAAWPEDGDQKRGRGREEVDLSLMSEEERRAYYKERYGGGRHGQDGAASGGGERRRPDGAEAAGGLEREGGAERGAAAPGGDKEPRTGGQGRKRRRGGRRRGRGGQGGERAVTAGERKERSGGGRPEAAAAGSGRRRPARGEERPKEGAERKPAAKPSLLQKIVGLFRKKN